MWGSFIAIGLGAALGAWARWGLSLWLNPLHAQLPLGTLAANLVGGYGIGLALAWFAQTPALAPEWRLFAITGLLGGLTTFSTFSGEVVQQLERQQFGWALGTAALHLLGSLAMTAAGLASVRAWARLG
ncbi:fluoride efflux transporter CrcB [Lysobacter sp. BMK333-48F3]|uniref:fluoride efflux transporter CrcB n=1 Tax=Lysobacter sp. BMK333-48F3 TaxID=2867962 RepID=UPI001C8C07BF|nr:fluoride efflux transporter CrcB [Lysobacter sp. BMK333-48F3]MBX9403128.1 fluoride efflux transporter CrcB [Lysobacter sp. BMK333-48F3]